MSNLILATVEDWSCTHCVRCGHSTLKYIFMFVIKQDHSSLIGESNCVQSHTSSGHKACEECISNQINIIMLLKILCYVLPELNMMRNHFYQVYQVLSNTEEQWVDASVPVSS